MMKLKFTAFLIFIILLLLGTSEFFLHPEFELTLNRFSYKSFIDPGFINLDKSLYEGRKIEIIDLKKFTNTCKNISRQEFLNLIDKDVDSLEIGAFHNPILTGPRTKYFDVIDKQKLIIRAKGYGYDISKIPDLDYIHPYSNLGVVKQKFDVIASSHNLEHIVDLISHFNQIEKLMNNRAKYFLIIPDKRYCFDHFKADTWLSDVLAAHFENKLKKKSSSFSQVIFIFV